MGCTLPSLHCALRDLATLPGRCCTGPESVAQLVRGLDAVFLEHGTELTHVVREARIRRRQSPVQTAGFLGWLNLGLAADASKPAKEDYADKDAKNGSECEEQCKDLVGLAAFAFLRWAGAVAGRDLAVDSARFITCFSVRP